MDHVTTRGRRDERAVSEMVGWIIVVGLIVSSISIVYFNGVPALNAEREAQKVASMTSSFEILQGNLGAIMDGRAEKRSTEIQLAGDDIELVDDEPSWINVTVRRPDGEQLCPPNVCNTSYDAIRYTSTTNAVIYENGAVIRRSTGNGSAMTAEPQWILTNETFIVPVLATRGQGSVAGTDSVSVFTEAIADDSLVLRNETELEVTVNVSTSYPVAWRTFGDTYGDVDVDFSEGLVTIEVDGVQRVIHEKKVVEVNFI